MWRSVLMRRSATVATATLLALVVIVVASAHARYDHSTPGQEQVVPTSPPQVDIYTAQEMAKISDVTQITVQNDQGQQVSTGPTTIDDADRRHFWVALQPNLPPGRYVVSFKNQSDEDGEQDHGQFAFYVGQGPTAAQKAQDAALQITSQSEDSTPSRSSSNNGTKIAIAIIVTLIIAALIPIIALISSSGRRTRT